MTYGDFKYLTRRTASDKMFRDKSFSIAKNPKDDGYQRGFASMVVVLKLRICQTSNWQKSFQENSRIFKKIQEKKSTLNFYRQYLKRRSGRYAINK